MTADWGEWVFLAAQTREGFPEKAGGETKRGNPQGCAPYPTEKGALFNQGDPG